MRTSKMDEKIEAQVLYDLRERAEFTSGAKLHEFFAGELSTGDPSPSGRVSISAKAADVFIADEMHSMCVNSFGAYVTSARDVYITLRKCARRDIWRIFPKTQIALRLAIASDGRPADYRNDKSDIS